MTNELAELRAACFDLARTTKWTLKPIDSEEITKHADNLVEIAKSLVSEPLGIDVPLLTRAIRYLGQAHAIPPMNNDTQWFGNMLMALIEVARPNSALDGTGNEFLKDMLDGITTTLAD